MLLLKSNLVSNSTTPLSAYFLFDRIDLDVNALLAFLLDKTNKWATDNLLLIKKLLLFIRNLA